MSNSREQPVTIRTPDGEADGFLYSKEGAARPGVVHLPDGIGLRESHRRMAQRLADDGYTVLLPNIYYRTARGSFFEGKVDFAEEKTRTRFAELTRPLDAAAMERDGSAYVDFLDTQAGVSEGPMGVVGFCFTGSFAMRIAAARPDRIAAAASFHGGSLVRDDDTSPHRILPRIRARLLFGHAHEDRSMPAESIATFEEALAAWGGRYESDTFRARHGWTVPDSAAYDEAEAERAYAKLRALFDSTLG